MSQLILCPKCIKDGRNEILGAILPSNEVAINRQRSKYSFEETTIIKGSDFELICGYCRTPVYQRKEVTNESSNKRSERFYWISFNGGYFIQRIFGGTHITGDFILAQGSQ